MSRNRNEDGIRLMLEHIRKASASDLRRGAASELSPLLSGGLKGAKFQAEIGLRNLEKGDYGEAVEGLVFSQFLRDAVVNQADEERTSARNAGNASRSRKPEFNKIIQRLAQRPGTSSDLWPALRDELAAELMDPEESATPAGDLQYRYRDQNDRAQTISKRRFSTRLSEARRKEK